MDPTSGPRIPTRVPTPFLHPRWKLEAFCAKYTPVLHLLSLFLSLSPFLSHAARRAPVNLILILTPREPDRASNYLPTIFLIFPLREKWNTEKESNLQCTFF